MRSNSSGTHWIVDIDGVCLRGADAIPGAAAALAAAAAGGDSVVYMTNNAMRPADDVAAVLRRHGFPAPPGSVLNSPMAAAAMLREFLAPGSTVLVVGERALRDVVAGAGYRVVDRGRADAVVVGNTTSFDYTMLHHASSAVREGAAFVATNTDSTYPTPDGLIPGAGSLVAAIATAAGRRPVVAGKPERPLAVILGRSAGGRTIVLVGDRLETDIAMGRRRGWRTVLVLTGVAAPADLPRSRALPDLVIADVAEAIALGPPRALTVTGSTATVSAGRRTWAATVRARRLEVTGRGPARVLVAIAAWRSAGRPELLSAPTDVSRLLPASGGLGGARSASAQPSDKAGPASR